MRTSFIMEDHFGPYFIKELIQKKQNEGMLRNITIAKAKRVPLGPKIDRVISAMLSEVEKVILIFDADGSDILRKKQNVKNFISRKNIDYVEIVIMKYEIEEWVCYSLETPIRDRKPSEVLKETQNYEKNMLKEFVPQINCQKLQQCESFQRLYQH